MDDMISRQAVIDICDHAIDLFKGQFGAGVLVAIKESIEELPPAQFATDTNVGIKLGTNLAEVGTDCISRQTAIDAIDEISREVDDGYGFDYAKWRQYFCELPSVKLATDTNVGIKLGTDLAEVGTDCISRQAAIDIVEFECGEWSGLAKTIAEEIKQLPSVQPEQQWIPCSERLPEESGRYLISVLDGVGRRTTVAPYQPRYKAWTMTGRMAYWKVIAWMPLPKPWEGEEAE